MAKRKTRTGKNVKDLQDEAKAAEQNNQPRPESAEEYLSLAKERLDQKQQMEQELDEVKEDLKRVKNEIEDIKSKNEVKLLRKRKRNLEDKIRALAFLNLDQANEVQTSFAFGATG